MNRFRYCWVIRNPAIFRMQECSILSIVKFHNSVNL